ncbi:hypothetical protein PN419_16295 [Halorubrum ezzemoulense]|nr:hypothetical protein [Halorubrum ezzemoulense]MDB9250542.1 hypothetical protein [Halorubrum ezzemoulense]MDB9260657.1 hypothetical protein [Halorubrum ezzemoulense]MDB9264045.1 hypothetical protein [Halorubrum ezzemoulense]MDB9267556.1 hypothetical protein [Halorubrum ezzemoulense]MDB9271018.1 hypothetical protein [Halorubrum ezzemoulense]
MVFVPDELPDQLLVDYENATVYGDLEQEKVLHQDKVRVLPNGWVALPTDRLLSPEAVHHIDP